MFRLCFFALLLTLPALPAAAMMVRPHGTVCSMEAMRCPDGSYVSRTGPNCAFAPCPGDAPVQPQPAPVPPLSGGSGGTGTGSVGGGTVTGVPTTEPPALPDLPLDPPAGPQSVKFIVEHRTALNDQQITVHGVIVAAILPNKACRSDKGMCAQPRLTLADTADEARNKAYDVDVILPDDDKSAYAQGRIVDIPVTVSGSEGGILLEKE